MEFFWAPDKGPIALRRDVFVVLFTSFNKSASRFAHGIDEQMSWFAVNGR
jgi:hypothetical protein